MLRLLVWRRYERLVEAIEERISSVNLNGQIQTVRLRCTNDQGHEFRISHVRCWSSEQYRKLGRQGDQHSRVMHCRYLRREVVEEAVPKDEFSLRRMDDHKLSTCSKRLRDRTLVVTQVKTNQCV